MNNYNLKEGEVGKMSERDKYPIVPYKELLVATCVKIGGTIYVFSSFGLETKENIEILEKIVKDAQKIQEFQTVLARVSKLSTSILEREKYCIGLYEKLVADMKTVDSIENRKLLKKEADSIQRRVEKRIRLFERLVEDAKKFVLKCSQVQETLIQDIQSVLTEERVRIQKLKEVICNLGKVASSKQQHEELIKDTKKICKKENEILLEMERLIAAIDFIKQADPIEDKEFDIEKFLEQEATKYEILLFYSIKGKDSKISIKDSKISIQMKAYKFG